jgi:hypothetical protein
MARPMVRFRFIIRLTITSTICWTPLPDLPLQPWSGVLHR